MPKHQEILLCHFLYTPFLSIFVDPWNWCLSHVVLVFLKPGWSSCPQSCMALIYLPVSARWDFLDPNWESFHFMLQDFNALPSRIPWVGDSQRPTVVQHYVHIPSKTYPLSLVCLFFLLFQEESSPWNISRLSSNLSFLKPYLSLKKNPDKIPPPLWSLPSIPLKVFYLSFWIIIMCYLYYKRETF